ncbi:class I SAM-dependent methyltransferase [Streptomyces sp. NPDC056084]|uniref:class I SAM-dependent methyltransferase n=1 Tax=unclassified Streptomyces TaxID=2593676 RepID=UPI0035DAE627
MSTPEAADAVTYWQDVYAARPVPTDPRPNVRLTEIVAALPPGAALDLGCGNGGDALWLARRGWRVSAVDISAVAVERLTGLAGACGLGEFVDARQHDLHESFPGGRFDLVNAHYLHTPHALDRSKVLRGAAHALRPGGRLLVVDHGSTAPWSWNQDPDAYFPPPSEVAAGIGADPATWTIERAEPSSRVATGPDGRKAEVTDHILVLRRAS